MKTNNTQVRAVLLVSLLALLLATTLPVSAQGPAYTLEWWTVDGGGATLHTAGSYTLGGTIGQPDAALWQGGSYTLLGGLWGSGTAAYRIYLPLVPKNDQ